MGRPPPHQGPPAPSPAAAGADLQRDDLGSRFCAWAGGVLSHVTPQLPLDPKAASVLSWQLCHGAGSVRLAVASPANGPNACREHCQERVGSHGTVNTWIILRLLFFMGFV